MTHLPDTRSSPEPSEVETIVRAALSGNRAAQRKLIEEILAPVVQARAARVLLRRSEGKSRLRNEIMDLCQQVFVHIFSNHLLERWEPAQGELGAFVGIIAENHVRSLLRSRVRSPFTEVATEDEALEVALERGENTQETALLSRHVLRRLNSELSDNDREDFYAFFVDERSIEEMCLLSGKNRDAVYKQRQRLKEKIRRILEDEAASSRIPHGGKIKEEAS